MSTTININRRDILEDIAKRNNGILTPELVVTEAKNKNHPLHKCFTWNNSVAAHRYRLIEAAHMIRSVKVRVLDRDSRAVAIRCFYNVETETESDEEAEDSGPKPGVYRKYDEIFSEQHFKEQLIAKAYQEMRSFVQKYRTLQEISGVVGAIEELLEQAQ